MYSYLDYLEIAAAIEASSSSLESRSTYNPEQINKALQAMLNIYTSKIFLFWDREFAISLRVVNHKSPFNISDLIEELARLSTTQARKANGDFEHLLVAIYTYLKQHHPTFSDSLKEIQVRVLMGRDDNLLCISLRHLLINSDGVRWRLPEKTYELYRLHTLTGIEAESDLFNQIKAILRIYAQPRSRTHRTEVKALIDDTTITNLDSLLVRLAAWINGAEFRGFMPDGDFEHAIAAIYSLLKDNEQRARLDGISVYLGGASPQSLKTHFPSPPVGLTSPTPASTVSTSGISPRNAVAGPAVDLSSSFAAAGGAGAGPSPGLFPTGSSLLPPASTATNPPGHVPDPAAAGDTDLTIPSPPTGAARAAVA